jgi:hypothetical protein
MSTTLQGISVEMHVNIGGTELMTWHSHAMTSGGLKGQKPLQFTFVDIWQLGSESNIVNLCRQA